MRAVKSSSFLLAAVAVVAGLDEHLAFPAAIIGLVLSIVPMLFAPKIVPVHGGEHGHHAGTRYKLLHPGQPEVPEMPQSQSLPTYRPGGWS